MRQVTLKGTQGSALLQLSEYMLDKGREVDAMFASKYMHFHCPAVPVFDSYAFSPLRSLLRWQTDFELFALPAEADETYAWYAMRFWRLYRQAREIRENVMERVLARWMEPGRLSGAHRGLISTRSNCAFAAL